MDSLTQFTLGAAIGEAVLGKKIGNKAIWWGGFAGLIPDLDVLILPFVSTTQQLIVHRGFSHSLLFAFLVAPILGYIFSKWYKKEPAGFYDWSKLYFWGIVTHPLLDSLTTYGTQLFLPFSDFRVAYSSVFIVDLFYSIPFLITVIACLKLTRNTKLRQTINYLGLGLSTLYLCWTITNKLRVDHIFKDNLDKQGVAYSRCFTAPTPLNNFLWYGLFEGDRGYYTGYYSFFDESKDVDFHYVDRNEGLLEPFSETEDTKILKWFSKDYYHNYMDGDTLIFNDLRFGNFTPSLGNPRENYVFTFKVYKENGRTRVDAVNKIPPRPKNFVKMLWSRMWGKEY